MDIYKITNLINNKIYIGKAKDYQRRYRDHIGLASKGVESYLYNAIRKYGEANFKIDQIDSAETDEELNNKEKYWIKQYDSTNPEKGYNMTDGGDGGNTLKYLSKEDIQKRTDKIKTTIANWDEDKKIEVHNKRSAKSSEMWRLKYLNGYTNNNKGRHWYNNGKIDVMAYDSPGEEWVKGRLNSNVDYKKVSESKKGSIFFNNGLIEIRAKRGQEPEGFIEGRLEKNIIALKEIRKKKKFKWYNNGVDEIMVPCCNEPPEGYIKGRLQIKVNERVKKRILNGNYSHSEETKNRISEASKKKWEDQEYREKVTSKLTGRKMSTEAIEKMKCWHKKRIVINNGIKEKRILQDEFEDYINNGWERGFTKEHAQKNGLRHRKK